MTPRGIRANQHDQLGLLKVLVAVRHGIATKGAFMPRHRRRHTQPRVGIDVAGANKAFGEFIDHIIIFGQQLARHIKRHCIRAMFGNNRAELIGYILGRLRPIGPYPANGWIQQTAFRTHSFAKGRAFHAQAPKVSRMIGITLDDQGLLGLRLAGIALGQHATTDPAIGASGFDHAVMDQLIGSKGHWACTPWGKTPNIRLSRCAPIGVPFWIKSK